MKNIFDIDEMQIYCGDDFVINDKIVLHQPTVGQIIEFEELQYFSMINTLTMIPSDMKAELDQIHIDWEKISDFELFCALFPQMEEHQVSLIMNLNPQAFKREIVENQNRVVLIDKSTMTVIDEVIYKAIVNYLCAVHHIEKKPEHAMTPATKKVLLEMAYDELETRKRKKEQPKSILKPLISTMINSVGFKYKLSELKDVGLCQFMDSVSRIQVIDSSKALLQGCYSGMIDTSKINKKDLNYMREL